MRSASLHIRESDLVKVLQKLKNSSYIPLNYNSKTLATSIVEASKPLSINNRTIFVTNEKLKRDTTKVTMAGRDATGIFAQMVILCRRRLKHRGLVIPKPGSPEWLNYKECTKLAEEFCNEFGYNLKEGFKTYIEIGLKKMQSFSIYKFKQLHEAIFKEYEATEKIRTDKHTEATGRAHSFYCKLIAERIGACQGFQDNPIKFGCFVEVAKTSLLYNIDPIIYIKAQFAGFDWRSGIPDPLQLNGIKAIERLQHYCFENQIKLGKENQNKTFNFNKIKKAGG